MTAPLEARRSPLRTTLLVALAVSLAVAPGVSGQGGRELVLTGFLGDYQSLVVSRRDNLVLHHRVESRPLDAYTGLMLDPIAAYPDRRSDPGALSPEPVRAAAEALHALLRREVERRTTFRVVAEPGPGVARVRVAVTHLREAKEDEREHALELYGVLGLDAPARPLALHAVVLEVEIVDSLSRQRLVAAVDGRAGERLAEWSGAENGEERLERMTQVLVRRLAGEEMLP